MPATFQFTWTDWASEPSSHELAVGPTPTQQSQYIIEAALCQRKVNHSAAPDVIAEKDVCVTHIESAVADDRM